MAESDTDYHHVLLVNIAKINESIGEAGGQNVSKVATHLLAEKLIEDADYQIVLEPAGNSQATIANKLFFIVLTKLKHQPNKQTNYQKLLSVLRITNFGYLADQLEATRIGKKEPAPSDAVSRPHESWSGNAGDAARFNYKPTTVDLADKVGWRVCAKWTTIAPHLGLEINEIDSIEQLERGRPQECMARVFDHWMRRGRETCTWSYLMKVLEKPNIGYDNVSQILKEELSPFPK